MLLNITLPKSNITLPISKEVVSIRPFTVKEEKILMLAQEEVNIESIIAAIDQIISNCTFNVHNIKTLCKIDAEYLYLQLNIKSNGGGYDVRGICKECKEKTPLTLDYTTAIVTNADNKLDAIELFDNVWVKLRYPTIEESLQVSGKDGIYAIAMILDSIIEGEDVKNCKDFSMEERIEFIESLTSVQIAKFDVVVDKFPSLLLEHNFTCKCGKENTIKIEGIERFFL